MEDLNWNDFEYANENYEEVEQKNNLKITKKKSNKRKWKEIENIKEKRKLKETLSTLEYYAI